MTYGLCTRNRFGSSFAACRTDVIAFLTSPAMLTCSTTVGPLAPSDDPGSHAHGRPRAAAPHRRLPRPAHRAPRPATPRCPSHSDVDHVFAGGDPGLLHDRSRGRREIDRRGLVSACTPIHHTQVLTPADRLDYRTLPSPRAKRQCGMTSDDHRLSSVAIGAGSTHGAHLASRSTGDHGRLFGSPRPHENSAAGRDRRCRPAGT